MDRLSLYYGDNLNLLEGITIKHPTLLDIKNLGYERYSQYVSNIILSPIDIADILWFENNQWYEDISHWLFFIQMFNSNPLIQETLFWFTNIKFEIACDKNNILYLWNQEKNIVINEHTFIVFSDFIRQINFIPSKSELEICGNRRTKIYLLQQMQKKRKKSKNEKVDLPSIVSSLDWKSCKGNDIWNFPIYRIYEGFFRLGQIDNYDKTMMGLYFGSIDTSKNPIDFEKINWSNIITI